MVREFRMTREYRMAGEFRMSGEYRMAGIGLLEDINQWLHVPMGYETIEMQGGENTASSSQ